MGKAQTEASAFSLPRIGLHATKLSELTFLFPSSAIYIRLQGDHKTRVAPVGVLAYRDRASDKRFCAAVGVSCGFAVQVEEYLNLGYPLAYIRGPEGIIVAIAEQLG
jgi:hypothetical protein